MNSELWDVAASFFLGRFESEEAALRFVQRVLDEEGDAYAENLELAITDDGRLKLSGSSLVKRVRSLGPLAVSSQGERGL
jgi:hypothetical protein